MGALDVLVIVVCAAVCAGCAVGVLWVALGVWRAAFGRRGGRR